MLPGVHLGLRVSCFSEHSLHNASRNVAPLSPLISAPFLLHPQWHLHRSDAMAFICTIETIGHLIIVDLNQNIGKSVTVWF